MKRILSFLSGLALVLLGPIGRMPAWAQLLTLGIGGVVASAILTPPSLTPQLSAAFDSNIANGYSNNGLKVNGGGAVGSMEFPTTQANSVFYTFEGSVDALFNGQETPLGPNLVLSTPSAAAPTFFMQTSASGTSFHWWGGLNGIAPLGGVVSLGAVGSGYNPGIYPWTASGGGCAREPSGVWAPYNGTIATTDPGFGCNTAPTIAPASIPGVGAQQATGGAGSTTCVSNSPVAGEMTVTANVPVAHGITAGQTGLTLAGFTPSGFNASNYAAIAGTTGTTLVLETTTGGGTCPASTASVEGTALVGTGATISIPAFSINPLNTNYGFGITAKSNDKFCAVIGEYGADSATPGVQFMHMVDPNGNAYPGAPAVAPMLNQGALNFTGYITNGAQDTNFTFTASFGTGGVASTTMTVTGTPGGTLAVGETITGASIAPGTTIASLGTGSGGAGTYILSSSNILPSQTNTAHTYAPALTVTAMASYSVSAASWASGTFGNGQVTLTTTAAHPFIPGSVLQFSGFTGNWAALNGLQFIAQSGTTGSTIVAGLYTGGAATITLANPGSYSSGAGAVVGTIEPNMYIPGVSGAVFISPYGTFGGSGTGGVGTYGLTSNSEGGFSITAGITGTTLAITTIPSVGNYEWVAAGSGLATTGGVSAGTIVESQSSGTAGGVGSYVVNNSQTISSGTAMATNGNVWSSAAPGNLYAANQYYNVVSPSYTAAGGGALTARTAASFGDFFSLIGTKNSTIGANGESPWGGALANIGDHWGVFPQDANGNPSTASLASLCEKTTDYRAFDAANNITTNLLYRLNDPGEWGDSSYATITGYLSGASGTSGGTATLNVSSTIFGSLALASSHTAFLAAPGLPPSPTPASVNPASIPLTTSASSTYTVTFPTGVTSINLGSSGSPVQFSVGQWKPAVPLGNALINGYITNSGGSGVCASNPCLNVTSFQTSALYAAFTGTYNPAAPTNNLTVSGVTGAIASGQLITDGGAGCGSSSGGCLTGAPLQVGSGSGTTWTVTGAYYPNTITGDVSMVATLSTVIPNMTITSGVNTPVQIIGYGSGSGGVGSYQLSSSANGAVGSSGSPVAFTLTSITGGGAIAPGPALTVSDVGAGTMYAVTNFPSATPTGSIPLHGTYSTGSLGGTPSSIQAQLSTVAGGPAVAGFSWTALTSQSISGGNWSGSITGVPPGIYWVSVRAANGTSYATMRNFVTVGAVVDYAGEGSIGAYMTNSTGALNTTIKGVYSADGAFGGSPIVVGPAFGKYRSQYIQAVPANNASQTPTGLLPEGLTNFAQVFYNATGLASGVIDAVINGTGSYISELGGQKQSQTLGIGDGSSVSWCSSAIYCANHANGTLVYNLAGLTGASITGSIATTGGVSTLTVGAMVSGALEPGMTLSGAGVSGSPTLTACMANCAYTAGAGATSTWTLSSNQGTIGSQAFALAPAGGAPWPNSNANAQFSPLVAGAPPYGQQVVQLGTFSLSVNGTQVCADTATFAYNVYGGVCTGAGIASSFIDYTTGAYEVTFSSPPALGAIIQASWTNIDSRNATNGAEQIDVFGNGTATSGFWSANFEKYPGGASAHLFGGCNSEGGEWNLTGGYAVNAIGFSQRLSWFYGTKIPSLIPGQVAAVPLISLGFWSSQGSSLVNTASQSPLTATMGCDQWFKDISTPSTFTGTVTGGGTSSPILTLNSAVTGALWEGEILGCNPYSTACSGMGGATPKITLGTQITGILSGTWGASGSTYSLTSPAGPTGVVNVASQPMINEVYYSGGGPAVYAGPIQDIINANGPPTLMGGDAGHPLRGFTGGRRIGARVGIELAAALSANPSLASPPTLNRAAGSGCDGAAIASPCFDVGSTYAASATATWSGSTVTISGGLSAHARPFVDGMAFSCSGCNSGLYIVSVSAPPTQSTVSGAGQIGNTFTFQTNGAIGGSGSGTVTGGCSGTSGTGSNCIDIDFSINTGGTYGTTASLATCGANNLQGSPGTYSITGYIAGTTFTVTSAPTGIVGVNTGFYGGGVSSNTYVVSLGTGLGGTGTYTVTPSQTLGSSGSPVTMTAVSYSLPSGPCNDNGVGEIVRNFRIGTQQIMGAGVPVATGSPYDEGLDPFTGAWNQSAAFTCNIVAATVVQCVKGPVYTSGLPSGIGEWLSSGTFVSYGDQEFGNTRQGGLLGNVGGQSLAFTAGSGGTNGTVTVTGTSCGQGGAFVAPKIDVTVSGGAIVDVYPSASSTTAGIGITSLCSFTTGVTGGTVTALTFGPNEGQAGYATQTTANNMIGDTLYDNSGEPGNPLFSVFANPAAGSTSYFEPGLPVKTWGQAMGSKVSG